MKVVINAVSAKLGGAATYVQNLARSLAEQAAAADSFLFVVPPERADAIAASQQVCVQTSSAAGGSYARRLWWDQVTLRGILQREQPGVLFSSANFAMVHCPCPQVLLVRIPIYFSQEYLDHVMPHKGITFRAETALRRWLVCRSVAAADCLMTPSAAMLGDLRRFARINGPRAIVNPYGVPQERVTNGNGKVTEPRTKLRLLWVSHYADHKDLGTLLRAADLLRAEGREDFELVLTLDAGAQSGQHTPTSMEDRQLLEHLGRRVRCVGVQSYEATWKLYADADVFVFPSLTESFGHPLVEAMAAGLPIVASDIAVHREICGDAAAYFTVRDAAALAHQLRRLMASTTARQELAGCGKVRVRHFLWEDHVTRLLRLLRETAQAPARHANGIPGAGAPGVSK